MTDPDKAPIASPATRAHAARKGVSLDEVAKATGRETLAREDVDRHLQGNSGGGAPASAGAGGTSAATAADPRRYWQVDHDAHNEVTEEPLSRMARLAADNLAAASQLIPAVTHHDRADMRAVEALRAQLKPEAAARGIRLTALAVHVRALARCLQDFPRFNASLSPDGTTLLLKTRIHVGIAVDTPHGLIVPVIRDANAKGLWAIADEIADLAARAQDRKVRPEETGGASMTISSLGGIGGTAFTPIVNPPELAILGLTRTEVTPVWNGESFEPVPMLPLDLSYDHRVLNGADAARFTRRFAALVEDPRRLLL